MKVKEEKLLWVWVRVAAPLRSCLITAALCSQDAVSPHLCASEVFVTSSVQCCFFFSPCNAHSHPKI